MKISQVLKKYFPADVRSRAAFYVYGRVVHIQRGTPSSVRAKVRGSSTYTVVITVEDDAMPLSCTCPYYTDCDVSCKHLWAVVLTAERHGYLSDLLRQPDMDLIFDLEPYVDDQPNEFADAGPDFEDDAEADAHAGPPRRRAVVYKPKNRKPPERPAGWSRVFNQIKQASQEQPSQVGSSWPDNRQLLYVIDAPNSLAGKTVLLEVAFQERKKNGDWGKPKFQAIAQQYAEQIREGPDAAVMPLLFGPVVQSYGYNYEIGRAHV